MGGSMQLLIARKIMLRFHKFRNRQLIFGRVVASWPSCLDGNRSFQVQNEAKKRMCNIEVCLTIEHSKKIPCAYGTGTDYINQLQIIVGIVGTPPGMLTCFLILHCFCVYYNSYKLLTLPRIITNRGRVRPGLHHKRKGTQVHKRSGRVSTCTVFQNVPKGVTCHDVN